MKYGKETRDDMEYCTWNERKNCAYFEHCKIKGEPYFTNTVHHIAVLMWYTVSIVARKEVLWHTSFLATMTVHAIIRHVWT